MKKLLALVLALCLMLCIAACGGSEEPTTNNQENNNAATNNSSVEEQPKADEFKVTVLDQNDNPVKGVMVQICNEVCKPGITNENGVATIAIEIDDEGYKLSVSSCPAGYEYTEGDVYLEEDSTEYTLKITAKEEA